ncbi:enhancer of polycomb homolog 1b isoform X1, partial [Tachysurus ichikawai]
TLDSLSAQFAASALVTSEQLMAMKCKEEGILGVGINGVISPSGFCKGLHHTRTTSNSPIPTSNYHQCNSPISGSNNGTSSSNRHVGSVSPAPAQVLLAGAMKVAGSSLKSRPASLDMGTRENHDQEKPTLNSITENTVAMEVT